MSKEHLLYYKPECPFCQRVMRYMDDANVEVPMANIHEGENLKDLVNIAGRKTVPCLLIDGEPMHESMDIINYMKENLEEK